MVVKAVKCENEHQIINHVTKIIELMNPHDIFTTWSLNRMKIFLFLYNNKK